MGAAREVLSAVAAVCGCLLLVACGDGDGTASSPPPAPSQAGAKSGLGPQRFRALDAVYVAVLPFDALAGAGRVDATRLKAAAAAVVAACEQLDARDPLLGPYRDGCPVATQFTAQVAELGDCGADGRPDCATVVARLRRTLARFDRLGHRSDRAIRRTQVARGCKKALLTPGRAYRVLVGYDRAMRRLERGLAFADRDELAAAQRELRAADELAATLPDGRTSLERFRSACA